MFFNPCTRTNFITKGYIITPQKSTAKRRKLIYSDIKKLIFKRLLGIFSARVLFFEYFGRNEKIKNKCVAFCEKIWYNFEKVYITRKEYIDYESFSVVGRKIQGSAFGLYN